MKTNRVDALVILGYPTAVAAKSTGIATVIAYGAGDPVATGLVQSLARPGGNITGISDDAAVLTTKWFRGSSTCCQIFVGWRFCGTETTEP